MNTEDLFRRFAKIVWSYCFDLAANRRMTIIRDFILDVHTFIEKINIYLSKKGSEALDKVQSTNVT